MNKEIIDGGNNDNEMNEVPMDECEEDNVIDIRKRPLNTLIVYGNDEHQFKLSIHDLLKMKETNDLIRSEMNELKTSINKMRETQVTRSEMQTSINKMNEVTRSEMQVTRSEMQVIRSEMQVTRSEMQVIRSEMQVTRSEINELKSLMLQMIKSNDEKLK